MNEPILSKPIPMGGRHLTSTECKRLRKLGVSCSESCKVMPDGSPHYGVLYYPVSQSSFASFGPRVTSI